MSENNELKQLWHNGRLIPWNQGQTHVMSHVIHYGSGCFEGIRAYATADGPAVFRLREHIERLERSAQLYQIPLAYSVADIMTGCLDTLQASGLDSAYIRPIVYYGYSTLGVEPKNCPVNVAIACFNWGAYLGDDGMAHGVTIGVSPWRKFHYTNFPTTAKACGQYLNSLLAKLDAKKQGFDEALLLNMEGNIAEGSGQNLFIVKNGVLYTNDEKSSILLGITRDTIIQLAKDQGLTTQIGILTLDELREADEAFFTGTASEVTPIRAVDHQDIGAGKPGPITTQLAKLYFDAVKGRAEQYRHWLSMLPEGREAEQPV
ncbi:branched-chain amino acid transaminase [Candidatus Neomarinimicrobiota bacterium]